MSSEAESPAWAPADAPVRVPRGGAAASEPAKAGVAHAVHKKDRERHAMRCKFGIRPRNDNMSREFQAGRQEGTACGVRARYALQRALA